MRRAILRLLPVFVLPASHDAMSKSWNVSGPECLAKPRPGLVGKVYRSMSEAVPHIDLFYPSCSRYIRDQFRFYGPLGLVSGFGRWANAHLSNHRYQKVVVNREIRLYDPSPLIAPSISWDGYDSIANDCSESVAPVVRYLPFVGVSPESW